jgi:AcrR family transcriptional regulator
LFNEQGYDDTSMDDIAERAGVSVATVANYFRTKDLLPTDCLSPLLDDLAEGAEHDVKVGTDLEAAVTRHIVDAARILKQNRKLVSAFMTAYVAHSTPENPFLAFTLGSADIPVWRKLSEPLDKLIREALDSGKLDHDLIKLRGVADAHMKSLALRIVDHPYDSARESAEFVTSQLLAVIKSAD